MQAVAVDRVNHEAIGTTDINHQVALTIARIHRQRNIH